MQMTAPIVDQLEPLTSLNRPTGVGVLSRVVEGVDSADMRAVWLYFPLDDDKARASALSRFVRAAESVASDMYPGAVIHVRFEPGRVAQASNPTKARRVAGG